MEVNIRVVVVTKHKLVRGGGGCKSKVGEREREREREFKLHQTLEIEEKYFTLKQEQPNTFGP